MFRTIASIIITFAIILTLSVYEVNYVHRVFDHFEEILHSLYEKTESQVATYEDGTAVRTYWEEKRRTLHIWLPHTALQEVNYQMDEAMGCLYVKDYESALPKIELLLGLADTIPKSYTFGLENIF